MLFFKFYKKYLTNFFYYHNYKYLKKKNYLNNINNPI